MTLAYTRYFRFGIPSFLSSPWHGDWETLVRDIDRILYEMFIARSIGVWANSTEYRVGDFVFDIESGLVYKGLVQHVSADAPTIFGEDRAAHPTYWQIFTFAASEPTITIVTTNTHNVTSEEFIILNKAAAAPTTINLPPIATRAQASLTVVDWGGNAGDISLVAATGESVMGQGTAIVGSGEQIKITPVEALVGWVIEAG